jgi:Spy/CpxP family protein refolding chaperone
MEKKTLKNVLMFAILIAFAFAGSSAYAWMGMGGRSNQNQNQNKGQNCPGAYSNLTDKQIEEISKERKAFFDATSDLRHSINQKDLELSSELAKKTPSVSQVKKIQKQLSELKTAFDIKRVEHHMKMLKINPDARFGNRMRMGGCPMMAGCGKHDKQGIGCGAGRQQGAGW